MQLKSDIIILPRININKKVNLYEEKNRKKKIVQKIEKSKNKELEDMYKLYEYKSKLSLGQ